jgi:hypothetical protein
VNPLSVNSYQLIAGEKLLSVGQVSSQWPVVSCLLRLVARRGAPFRESEGAADGNER